MTKMFIQGILLAVLTLSAHAGEVTIRETDSQIIVEYSGGEEDVKAARAQEKEVQAGLKKDEEEQERQRQEEIKKEDEQKKNLEAAKRRGEARKARREGISP